MEKWNASTQRYRDNILKWPQAARLSWLSLTVCCFWATSCTVSTRVTPTARSGIEQQLLVRSLERAVAQLPVERFAGKRVYLRLFSLATDQIFAKEFVTTQLQRRGVAVVSEWRQADLTLKVFAPVFGIDQGQTLVGLPSFVMPMMGVAFPDIALYKAERNRGQAEVQIYAFDSWTGDLVDTLPVTNGQAKYDQYTLLILISFTWSDLDQGFPEKDQKWISSQYFSVE